MWVDENYIAFDFETSGTLPEYALQPWRVAQNKAWVTSIATVQRKSSDYTVGGNILVGKSFSEIQSYLRAFLEQAIENNTTLVGWNTSFDISWFFAYGLGDIVPSIRWLDGMLLWRHWFVTPEYDTDRNKKKQYDLKSCVAEFLPHAAGYESNVNFHATDATSLAKLHEYNIRDTTFTLYLTRKFYLELAKTPQRLKAALIEADSLPLVAQANYDGVLVNTQAAATLGNDLEQVANDMLTKLAPFGVTEETIRSSTQLANVMFIQWKLPVIKQTEAKKSGKLSNSTDKETLHELSFIDNRALEIRAYREALTNKRKFVTTPLDSVAYNEDGKTHPLAIIFGTYTGRMTYSSKQGKNKDERQIGFAIHQMKRAKNFRDILIPPPGYTLMEFDAAGQEFRWMAIASGDETMLELCMPGEDPHSFMGARIAHEDYKVLLEQVNNGDKTAKEKRHLGKVANLSLQYRTSAKKLRSVARVQYNIPMELIEAEYIHKTYQQTYYKVPIFWRNQIALTQQLGYVETFAGRRVQVRGDWSGKDGWSMGSTAINYRIQGTGGDQKYLALSVLKPYTNRIGAYFAWELHDGIYFYIPDKFVSRAANEIPFLLANLPYKKAWGFTPPIPLPWDCKVGKSWGSLKEWK